MTRRVAGAGRLPETLSRAGRSADHCGYVALAVERSRFMDVTYTIYSMADDGRWTMAAGFADVELERASERWTGSHLRSTVCIFPHLHWSIIDTW